MWFIFVGLGIADALICGFISLNIAANKGHSRAWFCAGFFFSIFGILVTCALYDDNKVCKIQDDIALLERKETPKNAWICSKCGTLNHEGMYCKECGSQKPAIKNINSKWICSKCNHVNEGGAKYCVVCGETKPVVDNTSAINKKETLLETEKTNEPAHLSGTVKMSEVTLDHRMIKIRGFSINVKLIHNLRQVGDSVFFFAIGTEYEILCDDPEKAYSFYKQIKETITLK